MSSLALKWVWHFTVLQGFSLRLDSKLSLCHMPSPLSSCFSHLLNCILILGSVSVILNVICYFVYLCSFSYFFQCYLNASYRHDSYFIPWNISPLILFFSLLLSAISSFIYVLLSWLSFIVRKRENLPCIKSRSLLFL